MNAADNDELFGASDDDGDEEEDGEPGAKVRPTQGRDVADDNDEGDWGSPESRPKLSDDKEMMKRAAKFKKEVEREERRELFLAMQDARYAYEVDNPRESHMRNCRILIYNKMDEYD